eukprot:2051159-Rhodomonas_salina.1
MEGRVMVMARPDKLMQADSDRLEAWGGYTVEETTNTNKEGWWRTGDKGVLKGGRYNIWSPEGFEMTEIPDASSTPPLPLVLPGSGDERTYYDNTPSGLYS